MYADKDRQRECSRAKQKAYRLRKKGVTPVTPALPPSEFIEGMGNWARVRGVEVLKLEKGAPYYVKASEIGMVDGFIGSIDFKPTASHHPTCRCFVCRPPKEK